MLMVEQVARLGETLPQVSLLTQGRALPLPTLNPPWRK